MMDIEHGIPLHCAHSNGIKCKMNKTDWKVVMPWKMDLSFEFYNTFQSNIYDPSFFTFIIFCFKCFFSSGYLHKQILLFILWSYKTNIMWFIGMIKTSYRVSWRKFHIILHTKIWKDFTFEYDQIDNIN